MIDSKPYILFFLLKNAILDHDFEFIYFEILDDIKNENQIISYS